MENTVGDPREHVYQMITFNEFGHAFLCEKRRVSGVFLENLELNHFPFDVQVREVVILIVVGFDTDTGFDNNRCDDAFNLGNQTRQ